MDNITQMPKDSSKLKRTGREKTKKTIRYFDYSLLAVLIFLMCFGLVMLYSASAYSSMVKYGDSMHFFKRQALFCAVGLVIMYVVSRIDYHIYAKYAKYIYGLAIFMMALVQTPLGIEVNGARRWLKLPFDQQLQPSEIAKIAAILLIPVIVCKMGKEINSLRGVVRVLSWGGVLAGCVYFLTDNLSTAIIVFGISCVIVFVVHPRTAPFIGIVTVGFALLMAGVKILGSMIQTSDLGDNFRLRTIIVWLAPEKHASDWGYQVMQGLYAIGSGGFFGKGLGSSVQKTVIPEVQNDMILSVICEELGVFGAIMVLMLFGLLLYRLLFISQNAPDIYGSLIVAGIFAHIALQVILNVAVVLNLIPTTGITLPFISYGGTSILFLMIEMGLALGVSNRIKLD